jgi:hypothetical protein
LAAKELKEKPDLKKQVNPAFYFLGLRFIDIVKGCCVKRKNNDTVGSWLAALGK